MPVSAFAFHGQPDFLPTTADYAKSAFEAKAGIFRAEKRPQRGVRNAVATHPKQSVANASQTVSPNQQPPASAATSSLALKFNHPS
jgi:hypothetical protein